MKFSNKNGFTLIELLIAMFMFAIIATFLVPKVSKDAEKQLFATQLSKVQGDVQQAFLMMITKNQNNLTGYCTGADANETLVKNIGEHLEHNCVFAHGAADNAETSDAKNPKKQAAAYENRKPVFINKTTSANYTVNDKGSYQAIYLKNGAYVSVAYNPACNAPSADIGTTGGTNVCGYIEIDLNGGKAPNMVGKDIHYFWIHPTDGIIPFGEIDDFTCKNNQKKATYSEESLGCTAEVIEKQKIEYY